MQEKSLPVKTEYYTDETADEFSSAVIVPKKIDGDYRYIRDGFFGRLARFICYRLLATPLAWLYCKCKLKWKVKNRQVLKGVKGGYFLFANHTQETADAFIPSLACMPKKVSIIVHANNVSMPVMGKITPYMGALPLPDTLQAAKNFKAAIALRYGQGHCIAIYPEAHIWPYYIGIRNFSAKSFRYPVEYNAPCFVMTTTYQKRKRGIKPKAVTYLDGPFYPDRDLPAKEQAQRLRDRVYETMRSRAALSGCEYIAYRPKEKEE